jgi:phenol 2-monooxygenase
MGAFGLNASILDAANLSWKLGLAAKGFANAEALLPTYNSERRKHAVRIIEVSGTYLRFISGSKLQVPNLSNVEELDKTKASGEIVFEQRQGDSKRNGHESTDYISGIANGIKPEHQMVHCTGDTVNGHEKEAKTREKVNGHHDTKSQTRKDLGFLADFFKSHGSFLLGVDCPYDVSVVAPTRTDSFGPAPLHVRNGVRAPNPRVAFATQETGYLYDKLAGPARFHIVVFASSFQGAEVVRQISAFAEALRSSSGFYNRFGGASLFNVVLVVKMLPFEFEALPVAYAQLLEDLRRVDTTVVFDDRAPDEDAHTTWGVNHTTGGVAVIRPDLWVGATMFPEETGRINEYLEQFLHKS